MGRSTTIVTTLAGLGLLAVGSWLFWPTTPTPGTLALADGTTFTVPALSFDRPVVRQASGIDKRWQEAGAAYQTRDYARSERLFGEIEREAQRNPERHDAALYRGISLVMAGQHDQARDALTRANALALENGLPRSADNFYLGVNALARNDRSAAEPALRAALGGPFDADAKILLAGLRRP